MSLTPAFLFRGKTNCVDCGKEMGVNDQGIYYNVNTRSPRESTQDLMFCVPCAWRVTHAMVADLVKIAGDEMWVASIGKDAQQTRNFIAIYERLAKIVNAWADIQEEIEGVQRNAVQK